MPVTVLDLGGSTMGVTLYGGGALLTIPAPSAAPAGIDFSAMESHALTYPDLPSLDAYGRPDPDTYIETEVELAPFYGLQIVVNGVDVTYYRGIPSQVANWSFDEPFADRSAQLLFPQCSPFEDLPSWWDEYANVEIVDAGDGRILWEGLTEEPTYSDAGLAITCIGVLYQADLYVRAPGFTNTAVSIGSLLQTYAFNKTYRPGYRFSTLVLTTSTGVLSRYRGAWESPLAYARRLLETAKTEDAAYSIEILRPRTPYLVVRDETTVHWTVWYGGKGVQASLTSPIRRGNVIYGTGQTNQSGAEWRGIYTDPEFGGPRIQPLAYDTAVHGYDENGDGTLSLDTARRDSELIRIEEFHSFGSGVSRDTAKGIAEGYRLRHVDPGWQGTITLGIDPLEGSRFKMHANQNIQLRNYMGEHVLFHISGCDINWSSGEVSLTVDTRARDRDTIEALGLHEPEAYDPYKAVQDGMATNIINDSVAPWDTDGGSGFFPGDTFWGFRYADDAARITVTGHEYTTAAFLASERDTIIQTVASVRPVARFALLFFNRPPNTDQLPADPLADGAWDAIETPDGMVHGLGQFGQAAGYYPGLESLGSDITGDLQDRGTWQYNHDDVTPESVQPMFLWVTIWIDGVGDFEIDGRLFRGIGS